MRNDNDLFYTCGLIEHIGRTRKLRRGDVTAQLGEKNLERVYHYASVLHSDSLDHVADEYCVLAGIGVGDFDNVAACKYDPPEAWAIAGVFARLIEDVLPDESTLIATLQEVYASWVCEAISNYNTDFYYQPRSYIAACYEEGEVLE